MDVVDIESIKSFIRELEIKKLEFKAGGDVEYRGHKYTVDSVENRSGLQVLHLYHTSPLKDTHAPKTDADRLMDTSLELELTETVVKEIDFLKTKMFNNSYL